MTEALIGGLGALVILFFVFGTLPAVLMPIAVAVASILNTFTLVWILTYITNVSIIVQFLIALVGLGVAIDYALLMIFRFRDELRDGKDVETAIVETMTHAGRSVIVSGSTVAVGLLSMVVLPLPFLRSIGIGGMLIPAVSVVTAITLLPALLTVLGLRINNMRCCPNASSTPHPEDGIWGRWGRTVTCWPWPIALTGFAIVGVPWLRLRAAAQPELRRRWRHAGERRRDRRPRRPRGRGLLARRDEALRRPRRARRPAGADLHDPAPRSRHRRRRRGRRPPGARGPDSLIEAFPAADGDSNQVQSTTIDAVRAALKGTDATLGGIAAEDRDFVDAVYSNFPYVLAFVLVLTLILLTRAFRSLVLAVKAAVLNLLSLAAAYGIIVIIFQWGHGSEIALWHVAATQAIIPWILLMIFAFLFGLSMDYEVFLLTRMREIYDETGNTDTAIRVGLARTGKLVTSAALVLMFAFLVLQPRSRHQAVRNRARGGDHLQPRP